MFRCCLICNRPGCRIWPMPNFLVLANAVGRDNDRSRLSVSFRPRDESYGLPVGRWHGCPCRRQIRKFLVRLQLRLPGCIQFQSGIRRTSRDTGIGSLCDSLQKTEFASITDGSSNTFAIGEAASGFEICAGIGCTDPVPSPFGDNGSGHGWLVGGAGAEFFMPQAYVTRVTLPAQWNQSTRIPSRIPLLESLVENISTIAPAGREGRIG